MAAAHKTPRVDAIRGNFVYLNVGGVPVIPLEGWETVNGNLVNTGGGMIATPEDGGALRFGTFDTNNSFPGDPPTDWLHLLHNGNLVLAGDSNAARMIQFWPRFSTDPDFTTERGHIRFNDENSDTGESAMQLAVRRDLGGGNDTEYVWASSSGPYTFLGESIDGATSSLTLRADMLSFDQSASPISRPTIAAAASDPASTQTLANAVRTILLNYGLVVA
jgi:hypothetical protein